MIIVLLTSVSAQLVFQVNVKLLLPLVLRTDHRDERFAQDDKLNMSVPTQRRSDCFHTSATFVRFPGKTVESTVTAGY